MFVDSSALTAILTNEIDANRLADRLDQHAQRVTSPLAIWETVVAVSRLLGIESPEAERDTQKYLVLAKITVIPIPAETWSLALAAHTRFGKGRHKAALNFGDCFSYACARLHGMPLLYKGADFAKTDIETA